MEKIISKNKLNSFFSWCSVDFANSLLYTNLILYLPVWLTVNKGISDAVYNGIFILSTVLALIFAPILGLIADKKGKRVIYLNALNILVIFLGLIIPIIGLSIDGKLSGYIVSVVFVVLNAAYLLSLQFYDSLLPDIKNTDQLAKSSAIGLSAGWVGAIVGVLLVMPIISDNPDSRLYAIFLASILGAIVLIPALIRLRSSIPEDLSDRLSEKRAYNHKTLINILNKKNIAFFLLGYFIFMDSILTIQDNFSIYLERVFNVPDSQKALYAVGVIIAGVVGALSTSKVKELPSIKKRIVTYSFISSFLVIISPLLAYENISLLFLIAAFVFFGGMMSLARAYFSQISDINYRSTSFSWYSIAQKSSSLIGPLIWGGIIGITNGYGTAMLIMGILIMISIIPIKMCTSDE